MQGVLYNLLKDMHDKQFITDEEIQSKADVLYTFSRLTEEEYKELCSMLVKKI